MRGWRCRTRCGCRWRGSGVLSPRFSRGFSPGRARIHQQIEPSSLAVPQGLFYDSIRRREVPSDGFLKRNIRLDTPGNQRFCRLSCLARQSPSVTGKPVCSVFVFLQGSNFHPCRSLSQAVLQSGPGPSGQAPSAWGLAACRGYLPGEYPGELSDAPSLSELSSCCRMDRFEWVFSAGVFFTRLRGPPGPRVKGCDLIPFKRLDFLDLSSLKDHKSRLCRSLNQGKTRWMKVMQVLAGFLRLRAAATADGHRYG